MNKKATSVFIILLMVLSVLFSFPVLASAKKRCAVKGCNKSPMSYSSYCNLHGCMHSGCTRKRIDGSCYCSMHRSDSKKSTSKKKKKSYIYKIEMPDCDDYEDWEEFMDDWDGCMPDGSDASDYWDNW